MTISWQVVPARFVLDSSSLHVWRVPIGKLYSSIKYYTSLLSLEEHKRFLAYKFEDDRKRFAIAHGALRHLLGRYLKASPKQITYELNSYGKPKLGRFFFKKHPVYFNLSHSRDYALIVTTLDCEVGVDIEHIHTERGHHEITHRFFSKQEIAAYNKLPNKERCAGFFRAWARKEAVIKAIGRGLSCPLASFTVDLSCDESLQEITLSSQASELVCVFGFVPVRGYRAAVAWCCDKELKLSFYDFVDNLT